MIIFNAIIPIAIIVIIGVVLARWNIVEQSFFTQLSKIVFKLFIPIFLFVSVYKSGLNDVGLTLVAYFVPVIAVFILVAVLTSHRTALTSTFSNNVLVGIPVIVVIFGEQGLAICLAVISVHSLFLFSAFYLFSTKTNVTPSRFKASLKLFSNPIIFALLLGMLFNYLAIVIPEQIFKPLDMLANAALPLALIILGSSLAQAKGFDKESLLKLSFVVLVKLIILPVAVFLFAAKVMALSDMQVLTLVILAGCPTGINVMPFVEKVEKDRTMAHNAIAVTTMLSIVTIPIVIPTVTWLMKSG